MKNEELYLRSRMGRENHFRVPEGYFDSLADNIISQLPGKEVAISLHQAGTQTGNAAGETNGKGNRPAILKRIRPWLFAAACVCGIAFLGAVYYHAPEQTADQQFAAVNTADNYVDEAADYAMVDNQDIYACLMSEY